MDSLEAKISGILEDLKENYHAKSVKAEFGAEGTRLDEALRLKDFALKSGLDFTIKIGGCEAVRDMYDAKSVGIVSLVSPMIETSYSLKKYVNSLQDVFSKEEQDSIDFFINIESYTGYINLKSITESDEFNFLKGVVLGRSDMAGSLNLHKDEIDADFMFGMAQSMSLDMQKFGKDIIVGGGISARSVPFLKQLSYLTGFETRKIIFDSVVLQNAGQAGAGISKAIEFERLWIINRRDNYGILKNNDNKRLQILEKLLNDSVKI